MDMVKYEEVMPLVKYDAMCLAIVECDEIEQAKKMHTQARGLEQWAKLAKNRDSERRVAQIRIRAERKTGQLLGELKKSKGGGDHSGDDGLSAYAQAKKDSDIKSNQAKRWQNLAKIPDEEFETALSSPEMPTTAGILISQIPNPLAGMPPLNPKVVELFGWLRQFEEDGCFKEDKEFLINSMTDEMVSRCKNQLPKVMGYFTELGALLNAKK